MPNIVELTLRRPYTFAVLAILIAIFGSRAIIRTPVYIFPNIGIPVISAIWSYTGLPPDDMSGRIVYFFERTLTTTVNDIEHIELQSVTGYGIVKIFFQPTVDINGAQAQVTSISQTVLKLLPPGITPPIVLSSTRRASLLSRLLFLAINYRRRSSTISGGILSGQS